MKLTLAILFTASTTFAACDANRDLFRTVCTNGCYRWCPGTNGITTVTVEWGTNATLNIRTAFRAAMGKWTYATGNKLRFVEGALPLVGGRPYGGIIVKGYYTGSQVAGYTGASGTTYSTCGQCEFTHANVLLPAYKSRYLNMFSLHELGHSVGLGHTRYEEAPSCMLPSSASGKIEAIDLRHIKELYP
jgi:hypothetical protein